MRNPPETIGPPDDEERLRRRFAAQLKLSFLPRFDRLIESYHELPERTDLSQRMIAYWRDRRRQEYRHVTGVEIEQRDLLREKLADVAETGDRTIEEIIAEVRGAYRNGSSSSEVFKPDEAMPEDWL